MNAEAGSRVVSLAIGALLAVYFGAYFLTSEYVDIGINVPLYLVRYRAGSVSFDRLATFFEPARRVDEMCFRRKHAAVWRIQ